MNQILSIPALSNAAAAQVPKGDFGSEDYEPALEVLLKSLHDESQLEPIGLFAISAQLIASLKRRRQLVARFERHPEIKDIKIEKPIFILGFPRSGTTLTHNLFSSDPANRTIRLWEMRNPFVETETEISKAIEETKAMVVVAYKLSPKLVDIHPINAEWPDECSWLFRNSFASMVHAFSYFIPSYFEWITTRDMTEDYVYYRKQLQAILSLRHGCPLILKDPCHIWHIPELLKTFPDARILQLHRDPRQMVPSFISLCRALQEGGMKLRPLPEIGEYCVNMLTTGLDRMLTSREQLPKENFTDMGYFELLANPEAAMEKLYDQLGMTLSSNGRTGIQQWLLQGKKHTGKHQYGLSDFGLTVQGIDEKFARYDERFKECFL